MCLCEGKASEPFLPSWSGQEGRLPCFVCKGFPTFRSHLRMRPVSRRHSRRGLVGASSLRSTPISRSPVQCSFTLSSGWPNHALDDDANKLIFLGCDSQQKFFHDLNIVSFYNVHYQYQGYYKRDFCWEGGWIWWLKKFLSTLILVVKMCRTFFGRLICTRRCQSF